MNNNPAIPNGETPNSHPAPPRIQRLILDTLQETSNRVLLCPKGPGLVGDSDISLIPPPDAQARRDDQLPPDADQHTADENDPDIRYFALCDGTTYEEFKSWLLSSMPADVTSALQTIEQKAGTGQPPAAPEEYMRVLDQGCMRVFGYKFRIVDPTDGNQRQRQHAWFSASVPPESNVGFF